MIAEYYATLCPIGGYDCGLIVAVRGVGIGCGSMEARPTRLE
jgi:hypothetical protein